MKMLDKEILLESTESYLKSLISQVANISIGDNVTSTPFQELGIDSFSILQIIKKLEEEFGTLPKTLLFENFNIGDLSQYFVNKHEQILFEKFSKGNQSMMPPSISTTTTNNNTTNNNNTKEEGKRVEPISKTIVHAADDLSKEFPILVLEKKAYAHPKLGKVVKQLFDKYKNEGSASRGTRNIAPNLFIGKERRGYFNYSRSKNIILVYTYTGPHDYFPLIAEEMYQYCVEHNFELNLFTPDEIKFIGEVPFSATPFGVLSRIVNIKEFTLQGSKMRRLRYQVSKFEDTGKCRTEEYQSGANKEIDKNIAAIIDQWCAPRTMVNPLIHIVKEEIIAGNLSSEHRLFITYLDDVLQNVILISKLSAEENGYLMDLEFYPQTMPLGGLEFAIVNIIEVLAAEGCNILSLGGTYGCKLEPSSNADPHLDKTLDYLREQKIFNDEGNLQFKNKFRPENRTVFICRPKENSNPDNVTDIIMMIADPTKMQTSDEENHTFNQSDLHTTFPEEKVENKKIFSTPLVADVFSNEGGEKGVMIEGEERSVILSDYGYNPLNIPGNKVEFDLKTDSWAQLDMSAIQNQSQYLYTQLQQPVDLYESLKSVFPFSYFALTTSGRTAEHAFFKSWSKKGIVPQNLLFPTTIFNQIDNGFKPVELPNPEVFVLNSKDLFKGNLNWDALQKQIEQDPKAIAFVLVETDDNAAGGAPISMQHLKDVKTLLSKYSIPLVMDATRTVENAKFIIEHEKGFTGKNIWDVVRKIHSTADAVISSLTKDYCVSKGGLIGTNDPVLFNTIQNLIQDEGIGLDVIEKKFIALSLNNLSKIEHRVLDRIESVNMIWKTLKKNGIPVIEPAGGHCVLIDVNQVAEFKDFKYPVASFLAWMFLGTGIRAGAHNAGMQKNTSINNLVRLAIPVGLKRRQIDEIISRLILLFERKQNIPEVLFYGKSTESIDDINTKFKLQSYHNASGKIVPITSVSSFAHEGNVIFSGQHLTSDRKEKEETITAAKLVQHSQDIAIIGMSGRYPKSKNLDELWQNLVEGKDCIETIPDARFNQRLHNEFTKKYRSGFIDDVDRFDSMFFNISPREAEIMDPQERHFLEVAWEAIEDAGYYPETLTKGNESRNIGVFVGAVWNMYQMIGVEEKLAGNNVTPNSFFWSIANRVSYWMNFTGTSLTLDTACSSSLTAVYLACEAINNGDCSAAIVGGVNLDLHQSKWDIDWAGGVGALSKDGVCRTFGKGANGYVPGEGVGALLLKPLYRAIQDGDNIHGVIKSAAVNHGGKTSGYLVPNPHAQAKLIQLALEKGNIDARSIGYIEAHGTGTELGDPVEISGLTNAFKDYNVENGSCSIGSIKTNIGHLEAAAGIVGVQKVLLMMKHSQLVPSLHSSQLNEFIDFKNSPFYVEQTVEDWRRKEVDGVSFPLRAGISSFGAGGANAHVIIEKYEPLDQDKEETPSEPSVLIFPLSARNEDQLHEMAVRLRNYIHHNLTRASVSLHLRLNDISYTLQIGRKSFDYRLAIVARTKEELLEKLGLFIEGKKGEGIILGQRQNAEGITKLLNRKERDEFINLLAQSQDPQKLAQIWVDGLLNDWQSVQISKTGRRISLPTYPFADKRHWIGKSKITALPVLSQGMSSPSGPPQTAQMIVEEEFSKLYYSHEWEKSHFDKEKISNSKLDSILIFDSHETLRNLYQDRLDKADSKHVVLIQPGDTYQELENYTYKINPRNPGDYTQLFKSITHNNLSIEKICFAWPIALFFDEESLRNTGEYKENYLTESLEKGVYSFLYLCQSLIEQKPKEKIQLLYVYLGIQDMPQPHHEAINGFTRSLQIENPKLYCKTLEIQQDKSDLSKVLDSIIAEFNPDTQEVMTVRYVEDDRYVRKLKQLNNKEIESSQSGLLKENGVYIITGGTGGLGFIFAEFLANQYKAKLILTGRSKPSSEIEAKFDELRKSGAEVLYVPADVSKQDDVKKLVDTSKYQFGAINGIIHAAGVLRDSFIRNKKQEEMEAVFAPKIFGTLFLDEATKNEKLDFFVMFSSLAAIGGNAGQCDYSFANHFMDTYATRRNALEIRGERSGKSLSYNWSLWADGGMKIDEQTEIFFKKNLGIKPLSKEVGIDAFVKGLSMNKSHVAALEGVQEKIEVAWGLRKKESPIQSPGKSSTQVSLVSESSSMTNEEISSLVLNELSQMVMGFLKLDAEDIALDQILSDLGFDSIGMTAFANTINEKYHLEITPVLFFEYPTINEITRYLCSECKNEVLKIHQVSSVPVVSANRLSQSALESTDIKLSENLSKSDSESKLTTINNSPSVASINNSYSSSRRFINMPIAIVGMSGVMPQSDDMDEFWQNLLQGQDMVTVIPRDRWSWEEYDGDPFKESHKTYSKWGGFMKEVDKFDPLFFGISPKEAEMMDPQQRIFLETVWKTIEHSGHKVSELSGTKTGLFVGASYRDYLDLFITSDIELDGYSATGNTLSILVNRISFLLNLRGPSISLDTACSSSLIAIHRAVEAIHTGSCDMAIAGGIQTMLTPAAHMSLASAGMLSRDGKCKTFDKSADGYVRGEGSGAIFLKPLAMAEEDGDHIYAVIKSTAENHGGRVTTLTAPNPNAQAELLIEAYEKAHIDPATVGYIECHGTGTSLGDPIEIQGLKKAFSELYKKYQKGPVENPHCGLGSVKSNIGHLEIAAGIAGVLKVVLAIQHKQIPASLHLEEINPYINLKDSPFYIVNKAQPWEAIKDEGGTLLPRRAGVSSFGFGGVNGHIVLEEYILSNPQSATQNEGPQLIVLSAKNEDRLKAYVKLMVDYVEKQEINLSDFAYTLQVGRDTMSERLALVVSDLENLKDKFREFLQGSVDMDGLFHNNINGKKVGTASENSIHTLIEKQDLIKLAELWVSGAEINWNLLNRKGSCKRVGLPTYPFAREQYWISIPQDKIVREEHGLHDSIKTTTLHSLLHSNVSTLREQKFSTQFTGKEFYFEEYIANAHKTLPWVAFLEMVKVAGELSGEVPVRLIRSIVWENPFIINSNDKDGKEITVSLIQNHNGVEFVMTSGGSEHSVNHCKGNLFYSGNISDPQVLDIDGIQERCSEEILKGRELYSFLDNSGLRLGRSFQMIDRVYANQSESLAIIQLDDQQLNQINKYSLQSFVIDGALQSAFAGFIKKNQKQIPVGVPLSASEVQLIHPLSNVAYGYATWSVDSSPNVQSIPKMNLCLLDKDGKVLVRIKNLSTKPLEVTSDAIVDKMFLRNVWKELPISSTNTGRSLGHFLVFDQSEVLRDLMEKQFKDLIPNGSQINLVKMGSSYKELDNNTYEVNPEESNDYQKLFHSLAKRDALPESILYLWTEKNFISEKGSLRNSLKKGVFSLLFLSQSLMQVLKEQGRQQKTKLLYFYPSTQNDLQPHHEAISGFAKCLHVENPNYTYKTIEVRKQELSKELKSTDVLDIILPELQDEAGVEICYQDGKRLVKKVEEFVLESSKERYLKERGVYIITGGLGALGLIFARYIAGQTKARLILTGRSALRSEQKEKIRELESTGSEIVYYPADISDYASVERLVKDVKSQFNEINGIIHCAGVLRDSLIINKTAEDMEAVYASKIYGTCHLDEATKDESLDFFALFSSITAVGGNAGQSDYGYANSFMDNFVNYRNQLVNSNKRLGKTITFNWPLWKDGAMQIDEQKEAFLEKTKGIKVMEIETGLDTFDRALANDCSQVLVLEGNLQKIRRSVGVQSKEVNEDKGKSKIEVIGNSTTKAGVTEDINVENKELLALVKKDLLQLVIKISGIKKEQFSYDVDMSQYGFDSISLMKFFRELSQQYSIDLSPAVFYEYSTFNTLCQFLCEGYKEQLGEHYVEELRKTGTQIKATPDSTPSPTVKKEISASQSRFSRRSGLSQMYNSDVSIAIVGMSGVMPQSEGLTEFWDNIVAERDLITEIPSDRWDWKVFQVNSTNGKNESSSKWGGFMKEIDKFDPAFFGISATEAKYMDPQQRIFLETVWKTIEDAGHRPSELAGTKMGVFVGVGSMDYADVVKESELEVIGYTATGVAHSILPNRVSYLLDLHGPSEPVDTACSSSLVAIHRAVDAIVNGSCEMAIAGGVNALINPSLYVSLGSTGVLSNSGRCKTFDKMADGYVRGEGSGAIFLKKLDDAIRDGNHIYGVIKGIGVNHGGHAASLTAPNPNAQADLITTVYNKAQIDPKTISYIEVHGTGTLLGDSVEVNGLKKAFTELYKRNNEALPQESYCGIGTVKTNIGHLETAAGIAGVFKVLLGMKYKKIPGNIHFNEMNPHIRLDGSPFYIVHKTQDWRRLKDEYGNDIPLRAGISSFGFGGVNAHMVLEEYLPSEGSVKQDGTIGPDQKFIIPISAKNKNQLKQVTNELLGFIERNKETINLKDLAYTLQVGREAMEERLGFVVSSVNQLAEKLLDYISDKQLLEDTYQGHAKDNKDALTLFNEEMPVLIDHWLANNKVAKLLEIWVKGQNLDWEKLYEDERPKRISLPTYPFARERYWINTAKTSRYKSIDPISTLPKSNPDQISKEIIESVDNNEFMIPISNAGTRIFKPKGVAEIVELFLKQEIGQQLKIPAEKIATDQTFIELGLGSLALISLIEKTSHILQESLSPSVFFEHSDIPKFSKYLIGTYPEKINNIVVAGGVEVPDAEERQTEEISTSFKGEEDNFSEGDSNTAVLSEIKVTNEKRLATHDILVPMQTKGNNMPIFASPGSDGNVLSLLQLSKALGDKQPFYGFQAVGLDGKKSPLNSIEEIANINISVMQRVQPKGPYSLLGYSNGGVVAFEMTRTLLEKGEKVESLMLIDTPCPLQLSSELIDPFECLVNVCSNMTSSLGRSLDIDVEELRQVSESGRGEYVYHVLKRNGVDLVKEQFLTTFDNNFIMFMTSENCCRAYKPSKLSQDIDVLLFRATEGYMDKGILDDYGWNALLQKPIKIYEVKSNHFTIIDKGAVEEISKEIKNRKNKK